MTNTLPRYTIAAFCQGHGAECPSPEYCDDDHGIVSYCDGTCDSARWEYLRYLRQIGQAPEATTDRIVLELYGQGSSYVVRFDGPDPEVHALAYVSARTSTHHVDAVEWDPFSFTAFPRLAEALYPQCHHGLSLDLCADPIGHYPRDL